MNIRLFCMPGETCCSKVELGRVLFFCIKTVGEMSVRRHLAFIEQSQTSVNQEPGQVVGQSAHPPRMENALVHLG